MGLYIGNTRYCPVIGKAETLPYDAEVEYLQSSGTQYIDIGIIGNNSLEYEVKYLWISGDYKYILDAEKSSSVNRFSLMTGTWSNRRIYYNNGTSKENYYALTTAEQSAKVVSRKVYNDIFQNKSHKGYFAAETYTTPATITIFSGHNESMYLTSQNFIGRIYYVKIGNLDLIPVRVGQVGYLYDKNTGTLYGNIGTGSFTLGPDVT